MNQMFVEDQSSRLGGVVDAEQSPWRESTFIGRTLNRAEALVHPRIKEVFHITDHIVVEDQPVHAYFNAA